jgi:restriction endonuclease S subunit
MKYKVTKLIHLAEYISRGVTPKYTEELSGMCVINQKCIRDYKLLLENSRLHDINKKKVTNEKIIKKYDVLINSTGVGTAGRVAQNFENKLFTADSHVTIVRPDTTKIDPIYFGYALKNQQKYIEGLAEGSTGQTEISRQRIGEEILIKYPANLKTQKKISNILLNIDKKIELNNKINDNLHKLCKNFYYELIQDDSEKISLAELMDYQGGSQPPAYEFQYERTEYNVRFVQIRDFDTDSHICYIPISKRNKLCEKDDILIARYGASLGRICYGIKGAYNVALAKVLPKKDEYKELLRTILEEKQFYEYINSVGQRSAQAGFNAGDIQAFQVRIPTSDDIKKYHKFALDCLKKRLAIMDENNMLINLRDSLLPKLMNGEINIEKIEI